MKWSTSMSNWIRWILSIALIYGVYTETVHWTALAITFIMLSFEISAYLTNIHTDRLNDLSGRIQRGLDEHEERMG